MKKYLLSLTIFSVVLIASCSEDEGGTSCENIAQEYALALEAYSNDPTNSNCQRLNSAAEAYAETLCPNAQTAQTVECSSGGGEEGGSEGEE